MRVELAVRLAMFALFCTAPLLLCSADPEDGDGSEPDSSGGYENYYDTGDTAEAVPGAGQLPAPWPADTALVEARDEGWGVSLMLPDGGMFVDEEDTAAGYVEDPMDYPIVWINDGAGLLIDNFMLGVYENGAWIDEAQFWELNAQERGSYTKFPTTRVEPEVVELASGTWVRTTLVNEWQDYELTKLSAYSGSRYYSLIFRHLPEAQLEPGVLLAQICAITGSLAFPSG